MAWQHYLDDQLEVPGRSDLYAMQIAAEIRAIFNKGVKLDHFRLRFGKQDSMRPRTKEEATAWSKARWGALLGTAVQPK